MTEIQHVIGTAFIVAEYRAPENTEQNPLYRDPIVPLFLSEQTRQAADHIAADFPPARHGVRLRTRYFHDQLDEQLDSGCRQVVILGAGLDTRGVRKQLPDVTYFEIDDASILNFKQTRLAEAGIKARIVFIPGALPSLTASMSGRTGWTMSRLATMLHRAKSFWSFGRTTRRVSVHSI